jgi:hypothetical protein
MRGNITVTLVLLFNLAICTYNATNNYNLLSLTLNYSFWTVILNDEEIKLNADYVIAATGMSAVTILLSILIVKVYEYAQIW